MQKLKNIDPKILVIFQLPRSPRRKHACFIPTRRTSNSGILASPKAQAIYLKVSFQSYLSSLIYKQRGKFVTHASTSTCVKSTNCFCARWRGISKSKQFSVSSFLAYFKLYFCKSRRRTFSKSYAANIQLDFYVQ